MAVYMPRTVERDGRLRPPYDFDDQDEMEEDADTIEGGDEDEDEEDDEDEDDDYGIGKPSKLKGKYAKHQHLRNPATRKQPLPGGAASVGGRGRAWRAAGQHA